MEGRAGVSFSAKLIDWQKNHGRHDLPWQNTTDPYRIWLSEIMLQQTQVAAVVSYYARFLERFPDIATLAAASEEDVLTLWSGLGYYARARNLHRTAQKVVNEFDGCFPDDPALIQTLPGIGRSTAAAIAVFSFGKRAAILDGNVKRVFARVFGIAGFPGEKRVENEMWALAESLLPQQNLRDAAADVGKYTQGLMDLGATLCTRTRPNCPACPFQDDCVAYREGRTGELPTPRPAKTLPQRQTIMLLLMHRGEILLEKRPSQGIWGGLWSLPEFDTAPDALTLRNAFGCTVGAASSLPLLAHGFTHFRLDINPLLYEVTRLLPQAQAPGRMWLNLEDAIDAALPTPVRKILRGIAR